MIGKEQEKRWHWCPAIWVGGPGEKSYGCDLVYEHTVHYAASIGLWWRDGETLSPQAGDRLFERIAVALERMAALLEGGS